MNARDDRRKLVRVCLGLGLFFSNIGPSVYAVTVQNYWIMAYAGAIFTILFCTAYLTIFRKNRILSIASIAYIIFSPELWLVNSVFIFCYDGIFRSFVYAALLSEVITILYSAWFLNRDKFTEETALRRSIVKEGAFDGAYPYPADLGFLGSILFYGTLIPAFIMFILGFGAMSDSALQHFFLMCGGFGIVFFSTALGAFRIWYVRIYRTVKKYDLNW